MSEESLQREPAPGSAPGTLTGQVSQASPAADKGPDSVRMPQMSDVVGSGSNQDRDWEASFKGLNTRYQDDKVQWEEERQTMTGSLQELTGRLEQLEKAPTPQSPAPKASPEPQDTQPVSTGNAQDDGNDLGAIVAQMKAKNAAVEYRDMLLDRYTQPGAPGEGLPLKLFAEQIPLKPPDVSGGVPDDSAQRTEIETFIGKLKQVAGGAQEETAQALIEGWTPGSSPGVARSDQTADGLYSRFQELLQIRGEQGYMDRPQAEQDTLDNEYYELSQNPAIKLRHGGSTGPLSWESVVDGFTDMSRRLAELEATKTNNPLKYRAV